MKKRDWGCTHNTTQGLREEPESIFRRLHRSGSDFKGDLGESSGFCKWSSCEKREERENAWRTNASGGFVEGRATRRKRVCVLAGEGQPQVARPSSFPRAGKEGEEEKGREGCTTGVFHARIREDARRPSARLCESVDYLGTNSPTNVDE